MKLDRTSMLEGKHTKILGHDVWHILSVRLHRLISASCSTPPAVTSHERNTTSKMKLRDSEFLFDHPKLIVSMTHPQQSTIFLVRREAVFQSSPASTLTWLRSRSGTPFNIKRNASSGDSSFLPHPQNRLKSKRRNWTAECKNLELVPFRTKNHSEVWGPWKVLNLYRLGQRVGWWTEISIIWSCKALLYEPTNGLYRNIIGGCWCRAFAEFDLNPLLSMKQYVAEVVLLGMIFVVFVNTME